MSVQVQRLSLEEGCRERLVQAMRQLEEESEAKAVAEQQVPLMHPLTHFSLSLSLCLPLAFPFSLYLSLSLPLRLSLAFSVPPPPRRPLPINPKPSTSTLIPLNQETP